MGTTCVFASQDNIRALLSSMHTVLWEGAEWKQPGLTDMVEPAKVRLRSAVITLCLVIHLGQPRA